MSTRMSNNPNITRDRRDVRTSSSLTFEFGTRKVVTDGGVYQDLSGRLPSKSYDIQLGQFP